MTVIKFITADNKIIETDESFLTFSQTIADAFRATQNDKDNSAFPLQNITSDVLSKLLTWTAYHEFDKGAPSSKYDPKLKRFYPASSQWDVEYFNVPIYEISKLMNAANYLQMEAFIKMASESVANRLKNKTTEEMRAVIFGHGAK